jgi:2-hydroxychromene-2-carboxylate isomerase
MTPARPKFYFSFWSPYSWIASRLLEQRIDAARLRLEYVPYWPPDARSLELLRALGGDFLYVAMKREKHLYILQDIKRIVTSLQLGLTWPVDVQPWWDLPHLAFLAARRLGRGQDFFRAVHHARWEEGRNVCSAETIRDLASEVGLDPEPLTGAPHDPAIRREGAEALLMAHRDGVFGVPFFVHGRDKYWGLDRLGGFVAALEGRPYRYLAGGALGPEISGTEPASAAAESSGIPQEVMAQVGGYDKDCAGGCG